MVTTQRKYNMNERLKSSLKHWRNFLRYFLSVTVIGLFLSKHISKLIPSGLETI